MNSPFPPDAAPAAESPPRDDRALRLPAHCTTVIAEDIRVRLVLAADLDGAIEVDASQVESIGQATLQLLVAARIEAQESGQRFAIVDPSPAFVDRIEHCCLAEQLGLVTRKEPVQ